MSSATTFTQPQKDTLLKKLKSFTNGIRSSTSWVDARSCEPSTFPSDDDEYRTDMYPSPTMGTTAFSTPNEDGVYVGDPVYYDWGANWDRVKELIRGDEVQEALKISLAMTGADGYYFTAYDNTRIWPWLFNMQRRLSDGQEEALMAEYLTDDESIRELNGLLADSLQDMGEYWIHKRHRNIHEYYQGHDGDDDDVVVEAIWNDGLHEHLIMHAAGCASWDKACKDALYDPDREDGIREKLLLCAPNSYAFMPLNYMLAKLLSPPNTDLVLYVSDKYSVVHDATHNIVFDNFWYFCGQTAKQTLETSQESPQQSELDFDYTLGGLRETGITAPSA